MKTYYHLHPRNFANECCGAYAETRDERDDLVHLGDERLTNQEMRRHLRWVNGENDAWGSNRAFGAMALATIERVDLRGAER
mgnify:FL=1